MLRNFLDFQLSLTEKGKPLHAVKPLVTAGDTFLYEAPVNTTRGPHIRDAVDLKRWMSMVIVALLPVILMAIWNTGVQKYVYTNPDFHIMNEFLAASASFQGYFDFVLKDNRWLEILKLGALAFLPLMIISYAVGGLCEGIFACIRGHEIAEGFLVTGMLYPLILPPTIPYWMAAVGVAAGVIIGKELFGGTGFNILNPALTCRAFLFFTFPGKMSGDIWVGTNPTVVKETLISVNTDAGLKGVDGYTQATMLAKFNIGDEVKRVHVDAIASNNFGHNIDTIDVVEKQFNQWNTSGDAVLGRLSPDQMREFVTAPMTEGGLALSPDNYQAAYEFAQLRYGIGHHADGNFFFGNQLGSLGETSTFACLLGALFLIWSGVGAWRSMVGMGLGAYLCALVFQISASVFGDDGGAWNPARLAFPAYKHLLLGGMAFGAIFMSTDPVSSPTMKGAKWIYGGFIGVVAVIIRTINPAYPEGVMLAILLGNVFAPLIDYYAVANFRRARRVKT
ncbi:Na(+)-translocating NADH-quinone reductase subunit B [Chlamydiales bacterium SCGC AG-110-P3]|nr:Na(+)-translocating NADH-quinone reductase subunit B [Chlamydiales bacterium SCGC AG-110-P3]